MPFPSPAGYNPNIPQPSDLLSNSQGQILVNFMSLQGWIDINHVDYQDADNPGKHLYVTMPNITPNYIGNPNYPFPFDTTDVGFYNNVGTNNANAMWFHPAGTNDMTQDFPLGDGKLASDGTGWSYLNSGLLVKWGLANPGIPGPANSYTFSYPEGDNIPAYSNFTLAVFLQIQRANMTSQTGTGATQFGGSYDLGVSSLTTTGFNVVTNSLAANFPVNYYWVALGY